jgi:hypothetical protein
MALEGGSVTPKSKMEVVEPHPQRVKWGWPSHPHKAKEKGKKNKKRFRV